MLCCILVEHQFTPHDEPLEETCAGYLRVNANGIVMHDDMENSGRISYFLRNHRLAGPDKNWYKNIRAFTYDHAFRFTRGVLKEINGNLIGFKLDYKNNRLEGLEGEDIKDFLKVGDYSSNGKIIVSD